MGKISAVTTNLVKNIIGKPIHINLNIISTHNCTQNCPMCNAEIDYSNKTFTLQSFKHYINKLKKHQFFSCTISGGEPTLVKEMPEILEEAVKHFPFGVSIITNLYGSSKQLYRVIETALRLNVKISVSFDGFGAVADKLRGAKNVSESLMKNIKWVNEKKKELNSKSSTSLHTVISMDNLPQLNKIMDYAKEVGWNHTIAPVNNFFYQNPDDPNLPKLYYTDELKEIISKSVEDKNMNQQNKFLKGIIYYLKDKAPKLCPYLKPNLRNYKIFLEPDGSVSLCDRISLGTLDEKPLEEMFQGEIYEKSIEDYKKCQGCWLECFVAPMLNPVLNSESRKYDFDLENI